jgi:enamine deaminase RidA (YjgF/YER057c/UK114 family)
MKQIVWADHGLVSLYGEGRRTRSAAEQLADVFAAFDQRLMGLGLTLENAVRHRLWTRDRQTREASNEIRASLITGNRRCATSSFISRDIFASDGDVAVELIAQIPAITPHRRLVDFDPPRRYAHYIVQDGLLFLSGMAEDGATLDEQFDSAFAEVRRAMTLEKVDWPDILSAGLFIERGQGEARWLLNRFRAAVPVAVPYVDCTPVDGLASPGKHLEIEITAKLPR